ncbi:MAG: DoxX family membrane protein [bacterium]|nr:DoxX family membrane protein [bacterium]
MAQYFAQESAVAHFFCSNNKSAVLWLVVRVYLGYEWLIAGWDKVNNPAWVGDSAGAAITGFVQGALKKTAEFCQPLPAACHADVQGWYAAFLQNVVLPNSTVWSYMVAWGEVIIGVALILGLFVGLSAFFGGFMNLNFLLAGTVSVNPIMLTLAIFLVLAWRVAGYWGLDRYVLPLISRRVNPQNYHN